ncbi:hypothetical protein G0Q06_01150 [Puniceicoccales bacterium CK1056]|uniref:Uncharacterized protein n=1 Tax=Oceanipulchritudo coccoides TaxID=2706888 RepID=A0A6B2LYA7_9BACT|nr:hypothetical protein [Oceanipulchritudo coccoides]NDV61049.1 hypothetical protein [Oceanipulchritudo coccoides]
MSSPRKSTDSKNSPERDLGEDLARLHCLQALFPDWTGDDVFLLRQMKDSIEESIRQQPDTPDTYEVFSELATCLRGSSGTSVPASYAFIRIDFSNRTWDPLFAQQEIARELKKHAGTEQIFLLVKNLRQALFPAAKYKTRLRESAYLEATRFIDELTRHWSTSSSRIHLLYL